MTGKGQALRGKGLPQSAELTYQPQSLHLEHQCCLQHLCCMSVEHPQALACPAGAPTVAQCSPAGCNSGLSATCRAEYEQYHKAGSHFSSHSARGCTKGSNMFPASCPARAKNCSKGCHVTVRVASAGCGLLLSIPAAEWQCMSSPWPSLKNKPTLCICTDWLCRSRCMQSCSRMALTCPDVQSQERCIGVHFALHRHKEQGVSHQTRQSAAEQGHSIGNIHLEELTQRLCLSGLLCASNGPEHALRCALGIALKNVSVREDPAQTLTCSARVPCMCDHTLQQMLAICWIPQAAPRRCFCSFG